MSIYIDKTFISLVILSVLIISSLSWLVLRTLKEGRIALHEIKKESNLEFPKK